MRIVISKTDRDIFWNTLYRIILLGDSNEELDEVYNWCKDRYGKPQTNFFTEFYRIWKWMPCDGTDLGWPAISIKDTAGLYFTNKEAFTEFKLRWL